MAAFVLDAAAENSGAGSHQRNGEASENSSDRSIVARHWCCCGSIAHIIAGALGNGKAAYQ